MVSKNVQHPLQKTLQEYWPIYRKVSNGSMGGAALNP